MTNCWIAELYQHEEPLRVGITELYGGFILCVYVVYCICVYREWKKILHTIDKWSQFESVVMKIINQCIGF